MEQLVNKLVKRQTERSQMKMNLPEIKYETHFNPHSTSVANVGLQMISSLYAVANFFNLDKAMMWITLCFLCCWRYVMEMDTCV